VQTSLFVFKAGYIKPEVNAMSTEAQTVRKIVKEELPHLVQGDSLIRELVFQLSKHNELLESKQKTKKNKKNSKSVLTRIMQELKRETEAQIELLEKNREEIQLLRQEIKRNEEQIQHIYGLLEAFDRQNNVGIANLKNVWGISF
jgi:hypothetical protein